MTFTLALDPLTALELRPVELVDAAIGSGVQTVSMIVQGARRFPETPNYDLIGDTVARRALRQRIDDAGSAKFQAPICRRSSASCAR
jgi:hypothetical protein